MPKTLCLAILVAACAHDGSSSTTAAPENVPAGKYALHLKLNPGEVRKYQVEVQVHSKALMNDAPVFDMPMTMKFLQVLETGQRAGDGTTELKERIENLDVTAEGQMGDMIKQMAQGLNKVVIVSNVRPDGTVASSKTEGIEGNPMLAGMAKQMGQGARFTFLPKSPVGPGDTWTTEEKTPLGGMGGDKVQATVKSTLKFVGVEACGGKQCAHVESDSETSVPEDASAEVSGGGKGHSTLMIEVDSGRPWKSIGEQESKFQTSQQGQPIDITSKVKYTSELKP